VQIDSSGRVTKSQGGEAAPAQPEAAQPEAAQPQAAARAPARANAVASPSSGETLAANDPPAHKAADQTDDLLYPDGGAPQAAGGSPAPVQDAEPAAAPAAAAWKAEPERAVPNPAAANAPADSGNAAVSAAPPPRSSAGGQTDDLLFPDGGAPEAASSDAPSGEGAAVSSLPSADSPASPSADADSAPAARQPKAAPVISIQSDVDPESWAEYGGWYGQDYAIYYRPAGHKDKLIYTWLFLTGPQAPKGDKGPSAAVFNFLTSKDAQGSCTKCHSVDDIRKKGRVVNFSPPKVETKQGRFTNFVHEPHFGMLEDRGCLTCHKLEKGRPYLKSFEEVDTRKFVSNFSAVEKNLCQTCHASGMARQDCLLCHKYHVNGVVTPIMNTKIPVQ
jgi:hypothetical protein